MPDPLLPPEEGDPDVDFWERCEIRRYMTEPPRYDLHLPGGQVVAGLKTWQFFDATALEIRYIEATGAFPPLPEKRPGKFLREMFKRLLERRVDVEVAAEASAAGSLLDEVRMVVRACAQGGEPEDMAHGATFLVPDTDADCAGEIWINSRELLTKVQRSSPFKFDAPEFYLALQAAGLRNRGVQRMLGWRGRVWTVPPELFATAAPPPPPPPAAPAPEPGFFDELLKQP